MKKAWLTVKADWKFHWIWTVSKKIQAIRTTEVGNPYASDLVKPIFADPDALQLPQLAFTNPSKGAIMALNGLNSGASKAACIEPEVQMINATKAQIPAQTNYQSLFNEAVNSQTAAKRPRLNAYPEADKQHEVDELDKEMASPASHWQASPELTALIESFHKPLQSFDRKTICRKFPRADIEAACTPALDNYLCSLVSGVKQADKDSRFLQYIVLDIPGLMSFAYGHLNIILHQCEESSISLTQEQVKGSSMQYTAVWL